MCWETCTNIAEKRSSQNVFFGSDIEITRQLKCYLNIIKRIFVLCVYKKWSELIKQHCSYSEVLYLDTEIFQLDTEVWN